MVHSGRAVPRHPCAAAQPAQQTAGSFRTLQGEKKVGGGFALFLFFFFFYFALLFFCSFLPLTAEKGGLAQ